MRDKSYSRLLAEFATELKYDDIPSEVVARVKDHILDTVGCMLAGSTANWTRQVVNVAKRLGGPPEATIVGDGLRVGVANAVLANGAMGRAIDLDDTYFRAEHASAFIVPTALNVAEWLGRSGRGVITAAVAGYEVACRIGLARFRDREFIHDSSMRVVENKPIYPTGALFATAVEASKLMELDVDRTTSAMGFAGSLGLFLMQTHHEKVQAMPFNNGWACHAGVVAAMTAESGLRGPEEVFEGDRGYFKAFAEYQPYDVCRLVENLGTQWESSLGTIKFYPSAYPTHYFLNSIKALRRHGLRAEDVQQINCFLPRKFAEFSFCPPGKAYRPGAYDARFSLPYLLAHMLVEGHLDLTSFTDEKVRDPQILKVAECVRYTVDEDSWLPGNRGHLEVKTTDGKILNCISPHHELPGTPENPAPRLEIARKFRENACLVLPDRSMERLLYALDKLEDVQNVAEIMLLAKA